MRAIKSICSTLGVHFVAATTFPTTTTSAISVEQSSFMKRGLPYNDPSTWFQSFKDSKGSWAYNWDSATESTFPDELEFIAMLWGNSPHHTRRWFENVNIAISHGSQHILAFNEPDICRVEGSCLSPEYAAKAYLTYIQPFKGTVYLGTPAVSNGENGIPWLKAFFQICENCHFDFLPVHWYDSATKEEYFKLYMKEMHDTFKLPLWITEFNGSGPEYEQHIFLREVIQWSDSQDYIARYAWFWAIPDYQNGASVLPDGSPSSLGKLYMSA
ncbi:uncharacterized protein RAG0_02894 [Rhynchosporium agropyri]|uniref:Asl1-like glycosyl hydrolase catalytic domain-containing protein n=1 Tax=Rhynchosporium agropyri TaxID=914238 RepID=A0A1E1K3H2_9HELO|nr:uncharacterized protein RAG0_02894 [Rhynchosporium agropyri]